MILKLRTQRILKAITWKLIDGIKQIDYGYIDEPKWLKSKTLKCIYINTYPEASRKIITQLDIRYRDGNVESIFTDNEVYIMDDNGKTCEIIKPFRIKVKHSD